MTLYQLCKAEGIPTDNHESDLYILDCPRARELLDIFQHGSFSCFVSQIDGKTWIDVPFAFDPWWEARTEKKGKA